MIIYIYIYIYITRTRETGDEGEGRLPQARLQGDRAEDARVGGLQELVKRLNPPVHHLIRSPK